jgi:hypothetical protein
MRNGILPPPSEHMLQRIRCLPGRKKDIPSSFKIYRGIKASETTIPPPLPPEPRPGPRDKKNLRRLLLGILLVVIAGVASYILMPLILGRGGLSGKYIVTVEGEIEGRSPFYGYVLEFKPNEDVFITSTYWMRMGGRNEYFTSVTYAGKYEIQANKITITIEVLGMKYVLRGEVGDNIIVLEGSLLEKEGFKLQPEITGKYVCTHVPLYVWEFDEGTIFDFKSNREVHVTYSSGRTNIGEYMAYKNRITIVFRENNHIYAYSGSIADDKIYGDVGFTLLRSP